MVGFDGELHDGCEHGDASGLVDIDAVDGFDVDFGDGPGESFGADDAVHAFALIEVELLGVAEAAQTEVFREDDGGGDDGAEEGATTDFVNAGDQAGILLARLALVFCSAFEGLQEVHLAGGGSEVFPGLRGEP
jgi:hypothetical protein